MGSAGFYRMVKTIRSGPKSGRFASLLWRVDKTHQSGNGLKAGALSESAQPEFASS
jgi:hypothetical protein